MRTLHFCIYQKNFEKFAKLVQHRENLMKYNSRLFVTIFLDE